MSYFPDLSAYSYHPGSTHMLNIGWLSQDHVFVRGPVPETFTQQLRQLCEQPLNSTRGRHRCPFCPAQQKSNTAAPSNDSAPQDLPYGNAEIQVQGADGLRYSAPSLILHYVVKHQYQPPSVFIDAVLHHGERLANTPSS